jgi:hypothetical protein
MWHNRVCFAMRVIGSFADSDVNFSFESKRFANDRVVSCREKERMNALVGHQPGCSVNSVSGF